MSFGLLESIAYAIARGVARAYFDVLREGRTGVEETVNDDDRRRAARLRDAIRLHHPAGVDPKPDDPAPRGGRG